MKKCITSLLILMSVNTFAQSRCAVAEIDSIRSLNNPSFNFKKALINKEISKNVISDRLASSAISGTVIKIPVVVHVLTDRNPEDIGGLNNNNISEEQILSQIKVLNQDYRRQAGTNGFNTNPVGVDMEIEFSLATIDPNGNSTNGITRTKVSQSTFDITGEYLKIGNLIHWDYEKYLNIWVLTANGRNLGYGAFPYDANVRGLEFDQTSLNEQKQFDGVIIDYRYFGTVGAVTSKTYGWGRTASHEIGHWLGLLHPNGDIRCGDDYCNDTPTIESLNNSTNCNKITSNCTGVVVQNMIENYMDYSPDFCMNVFTQDQKDRVRSVLDKSPTRQKIVTANTDLPESDKLAITIKPNPTSDLAKIEVLFKSTKSIYVNVFDYSGKSFYTNTYENQSSSLIYLDTSKYPNGNYILQVIAGDESLSKHLIVNR